MTAVCSTRNVDLVRSLGADHVIDYTREDFTRSGQRYDVIFQLAGTDSPGACRRALTPAGTLILSSGAGTVILDRLLKAVVLSKFVSQRLVVFEAALTHADLVAVRDLLVAGTIRTRHRPDLPAGRGAGRDPLRRRGPHPGQDGRHRLRPRARPARTTLLTTYW